MRQSNFHHTDHFTTKLTTSTTNPNLITFFLYPQYEVKVPVDRPHIVHKEVKFPVHKEVPVPHHVPVSPPKHHEHHGHHESYGGGHEESGYGGGHEESSYGHHEEAPASSYSHFESSHEHHY